MADFVDLRHVPVLMTGTWNASTGREPITDEDLMAIVEAYSSGMLDPAVLKKGHTDPRFNNYLEDGEPAYGQVMNPVIEDGVLYVDYVKVPAELAESMESAYPRCSVELARNVQLHDQDGNLKAQFDVALTAVALLGATPPAVKGLSVRASALPERDYDTRTILPISQFSAVSAFAFPGGNTARVLGDKLGAAVRAAYSGEATWAYLEDFSDEAVVFGVESESDMVFYRQAYSAASDGSVSLTGQPVQVVRETRWVAEPARDTTPNLPTLEPAMSHAMSEASESEPQTPSSPEGETKMTTVDKDTAAELRRRYGLPNNASYEDILAAMLENGATAPRPTVAPGTDEDDNDERVEKQVEEFEKNYEANSNPLLSAKPEEKETVAAPSVDVAALAESLRGQFVSPSAFAAYQAEHEAIKAELAAEREAKDKKRRDDMVTGWFSTGRIGPDDAKEVRESLDKPGAEDIVRSIIDARPALFSNREVGHGLTTPDVMAADTAKTLEAAQLEADDAIFGTSIK